MITVYMSVTTALRVAADHGFPVSRVTMISWAKERGIGKKVGGRWYVKKELLVKMLKGELKWKKK